MMYIEPEMEVFHLSEVGTQYDDVIDTSTGGVQFKDPEAKQKTF